MYLILLYKSLTSQA